MNWTELCFVFAHNMCWDSKTLLLMCYVIRDWLISNTFVRLEPMRRCVTNERKVWLSRHYMKDWKTFGVCCHWIECRLLSILFCYKETISKTYLNFNLFLLKCHRFNHSIIYSFIGFYFQIFFLNLNLIKIWFRKMVCFLRTFFSLY
jgi:hypothetical protein